MHQRVRGPILDYSQEIVCTQGFEMRERQGESVTKQGDPNLPSYADQVSGGKIGEHVTKEPSREGRRSRFRVIDYDHCKREVLSRGKSWTKTSAPTAPELKKGALQVFPRLH